MPNSKRDAAIFNFYLRGWTYQRIAERYGLSVARINQIIREQKELNEWSGSRAA